MDLEDRLFQLYKFTSEFSLSARSLNSSCVFKNMIRTKIMVRWSLPIDRLEFIVANDIRQKHFKLIGGERTSMWRGSKGDGISRRDCLVLDFILWLFAHSAESGSGSTIENEKDGFTYTTYQYELMGPRT